MDKLTINLNAVNKAASNAYDLHKQTKENAAKAAEQLKKQINTYFNKKTDNSANSPINKNSLNSSVNSNKSVEPKTKEKIKSSLESESELSESISKVCTKELTTIVNKCNNQAFKNKDLVNAIEKFIQDGIKKTLETVKDGKILTDNELDIHKYEEKNKFKDICTKDTKNSKLKLKFLKNYNPLLTEYNINQLKLDNAIKYQILTKINKNPHIFKWIVLLLLYNKFDINTLSISDTSCIDVTATTPTTPTTATTFTTATTPTSATSVVKGGTKNAASALAKKVQTAPVRVPSKGVVSKSNNDMLSEIIEKYVKIAYINKDILSKLTPSNFKDEQCKDLTSSNNTHKDHKIHTAGGLFSADNKMNFYIYIDLDWKQRWIVYNSLIINEKNISKLKKTPLPTTSFKASPKIFTPLTLKTLCDPAADSAMSSTNVVNLDLKTKLFKLLMGTYKESSKEPEHATAVNKPHHKGGGLLKFIKPIEIIKHTEFTGHYHKTLLNNYPIDNELLKNFQLILKLLVNDVLAKGDDKEIRKIITKIATKQKADKEAAKLVDEKSKILAKKAEKATKDAEVKAKLDAKNITDKAAAKEKKA